VSSPRVQIDKSGRKQNAGRFNCWQILLLYFGGNGPLKSSTHT
jgi:hypothetical protein